MAQTFGLGCLSEFYEANANLSGVHENTYGGIQFLKNYMHQSCDFIEDLVPLRKYFKSISRIIRRPKSNRIEDLIIALTSLLGLWILGLVSNYTFFYKKNFYNKMKLKNPKPLRKC